MHGRKRWRMRVNDFALARGATEAITEKQTAEKLWEPRFLAEIIAGRDPKVPPHVPKAAEGLTITGFLDQYYESHVQAEGLRDPATIQSRLKAIKTAIGHLPVTALEKPADILRFKAAFRKGREISTVNRALSVLRAAITWGRFQDPPYLTTTPFHRFGVSINVKEERKRDRRIGLQEEQMLLAACSEMAGAEHKFVGPTMHDRIIGALETCCRRGEMLRIQNRHIDWERHQVAIPGRHAKDAENRRIPFDPQGRLAPILKRRSTLGSNAFVFGSSAGEFVADFKNAWASLLLVANGYDAKHTRPGVRVDQERLHQIDLHWHDLRHEGACRLLSDGVDIRTIQLMLGHADIKQTQRYLNITDEELRKAMTGVWERRRQLRAVGQ
jgi:integrase